MIPPAIPANEAERIRALQGYSILDTLPEKEFDDITKIASKICNTPISLITLIDINRQWYKSKIGLEGDGGSREFSFCAHAINAPHEIFMVPDTRKDERFYDNPFVVSSEPAIFYAGIPLVDGDGFALGTLCVVDDTPRELTEEQIETLTALSNQVVKLFELRKLNNQLAKSEKETNQRYKELEKFAYVISHDLKSPLNNILSLTEMLSSTYKSKLGDDGERIMDYLSKSSVQMKNYVDSIIMHYTGVNIAAQQKSKVNLREELTGLIQLLDSSKLVSLTMDLDSDIVTTNEAALRQILMNLISNAIKYNDKERVELEVTSREHIDKYQLRVKDNGIGIPRSEIDKIFEPFTTLGVKDRFNNLGTGIGLSTVKQVIEKMGGTINVISKEGVGTIFEFILPK